MASLTFIVMMVCLCTAVKVAPKVKHITITHERIDSIVDYYSNDDSDYTRVSLDIEFD